MIIAKQLDRAAQIPVCDRSNNIKRQINSASPGRNICRKLPLIGLFILLVSVSNTHAQQLSFDQIKITDTLVAVDNTDKAKRLAGALPGDSTSSYPSRTGQRNEPIGSAPVTSQSTSPAPESSEPPRRAKPAPLDSVFPSSEYIGPTIGVPDTDPVYPLTKAIWDHSEFMKRNRIKVYGWVNPGVSFSTSRDSNIPQTYSIVPNRLELDQAVLRFERVPDTVQTDHVDWGFRLTSMYGIDYRWTTAQGYFSGQLLRRNQLYGYDPVEMYGLIYFPQVAKGMVLKFGRYISPPDIEAQLAPDNYLFTHSVMFDYDAYTNTGILASIKLDEQWQIQLGIHAGKDVAPWGAGAHPSFQAMARWVSKNNNDSLYGGIASLNNGRFKGNLDNLNQFNLTWTHRFNEKGTFLTTTEAYYLQTSGARVGGSVINGPPKRWFTNVGIGAPIQGNAPAVGIVNYTEIKLSKKDFLSLRPLDILDDKKGERSGFATTIESWTIGLTHRFSDLISTRPEARFEHAYSAKPYDNGTRRNQFTFAIDVIARF